MADGKYHTAADLQKFVDERIHDAKAKADLNKIVSDYRAATGEPGNAAGTTSDVRQVRGETPSVREVPTQGRNKLGVPGTRPKLEKANVSDFGRRQAQFFANLQRNPIEKEFAQSYLDARLNGKPEPKPIASLPAQRAAQLKSSINLALPQSSRPLLPNASLRKRSRRLRPSCRQPTKCRRASKNPGAITQN